MSSRQAGWRRRAGVLAGALVMCIGATLLPSPPRQGKAQPHILYTGSGPPSVPEFLGTITPLSQSLLDRDIHFPS